MKIPARWRVWLITFSVALMAALIFIVGPWLLRSSAREPLHSATRVAGRSPSPGPPLASESGPLLDVLNAPWLTQQDTGGRTLQAFYQRRQYPGSPPVIPHPVEPPEGTSGETNCQSCHTEGGYVEPYESYAPVTPHPTYGACTQCHVPQKTDELFRKSRWMSVTPPRMFSTGLPGAPPPIPHDLQMRGRCVSCHAGPAAIEALRTSHPERSNCRQCHLAQTDRRSWSRGARE